MKNFFTNIWVHIIFVFVLGFFIFGRLNGFCEALPLSLSPEAFNVIEQGSKSFTSTGFNFGTMNPIAAPYLYDQVNQALFNTFGYDIDDALTDSWNEVNSSENNMNALTNYVQDKNTIYDNLKQAINFTWGSDLKTLTDKGYRFFSQVVPQWGENAKQFFLGKYNDLTGEIYDVASPMVTKITAEGLMAYNQVYNNFVNSGDIVKRTDNNAYIGNSIYYTNKYSNYSFCYNFTSPVFFSCYRDGSLSCYVPLSQCSIDNTYNLIRLNNFDSGYIIHNGTVTPFQSIIPISYDSGDIININGVDWYYYETLYNNANLATICDTKLGRGGFDSYREFLTSLLSSNPTLTNSSISYDYSSSALSQSFKDQLDRLIGKYVDSITLGRINDIVASIPIGNELVGDTSVPVAIPTQELVDELTGVIDHAIELDPAYSIAFEEAYDEAIATTPDPSPDFPQFPSGVPEGYVPPFLTDLFPTDMFSMFEPIFDIVGDQYSMFDTWLLIPAIFIFLFIFYVIISVL